MRKRLSNGFTLSTSKSINISILPLPKLESVEITIDSESNDAAEIQRGNVSEDFEVTGGDEENTNNNKIYLTRELRRDLVKEALRGCVGQKGTIDDIIKYISKHKDFIQPSKKQVSATINAMFSRTRELRKTGNKVGKRFEYIINSATERAKRKLSDSFQAGH